tara:strand:+ start:291 stop:794 length:504 start_codon:yes stop_codon:yes gene_type:complete
MFKVVNNFLHKDYFFNIQSQILSPSFPWYFVERKDLLEGDERTDIDLNQYQYGHIFYGQDKPLSDGFNLMQPLLDKLEVKSLIRMKVNSVPYSSKFYEGYFHTDNNFACKCCILYINTNDGYTHFEHNNKKVSSEENKAVLFDSKFKHRGTNTTNQKQRVVLNIVYF